MSKFKKEYLVPYFNTDKNGYLRFPNILAYMAETSSWHSDSIGAGIEELVKRNIGWMLNRWEVKVNKYPRAKDSIFITTWTSGFNKFYATREFTMEDKEGNIFALATTQWILIDMNRKRPIRIPVDFIEKYKRIEEFNFSEFTDFNIIVDDIEESSNFTVRRSDIDNNNHVNNIKYVDWIIEDMKIQTYENETIEEFSIIYKKEILEGSEINIGKKEVKGEFIHKITTYGDVNAIARTKWKKKD